MPTAETATGVAGLDPQFLHVRKCRGASFLSLGEELIPNEGQRRPLARLCSLMRKSGAHWIMLDLAVHDHPRFKTNYPAVVREVRELRRRLPGVQVKVRQVTFFGSDIRWQSGGPRTQNFRINPHRPTKTANQILATCVILNLLTSEGRHDFVFEAVVAVPSVDQRGERSPLLNNYVHVYANTKVVVGGNNFAFDAAYFCQQNGVTTACAHSCLKMALWHVVKGYQPSTRIINDAAKRERNRREGPLGLFDPSKGLSVDEIAAVCDKFRVEMLNVDFQNSKNAHISPYELAYLLVESGIPTIIVFKPKPGTAAKTFHMVPVIGHTMNTDEWFPFAARRYKDIPLLALNTIEHEYISSAEWASHLIMHDDLLGPFLCIGPNSLTRKGRSDEDLAGRTCQVIGIMPKGLRRTHSPIIAQEVGKVYFWNLWDHHLDAVPEPWKSRITTRWEKSAGPIRFRDLVLRTQVISRTNYVEHLRSIVDHEGRTGDLGSSELLHLRRKLPKLMWMVEFSLPELFCTNRTKLGEILLTLDASEQEALIDLKAGDPLPPPVAFRLVNILDTFNMGPLSLGFRSHTQLYRRRPIQYEF